MIKQSQRRIATRRKGALQRRSEDLKMWESKLHKDADNKEYQSKVEIAKAEVATLTKKVGSIFS